MTKSVAFVSQKGGVGKSTLARLIAREAAAGEWTVQICDLDTQQLSSTTWAARRAEAGLSPALQVSPAGSAAQALAAARDIDLLVIDAPARASAATLEIARAVDLVVQPVSASLDDLHPGVLLAHELVKKGIPPSKIAFVLIGGVDTEAEERDARAYIEQAGYTALPGSIPHRPAFRQAQNTGRALSEVGPVTLRKRVGEVARAIAEKLAN